MYCPDPLYFLGKFRESVNGIRFDALEGSDQLIIPIILRLSLLRRLCL